MGRRDPVGPPKARPGSVYRFAVMQRDNGAIIGGSTFELRVLPAEVVVRG